MNKGKILISVIALCVVLVAGWFILTNIQKKETKKCGNVVLEGYLVGDCPWQQPPILSDCKPRDEAFSYCVLDVWFSKSEPEKGIPEICYSNPLTSKCFLEPVSQFNVWGEKLINNNYVKATLVGKYEKKEVCNSAGGKMSNLPPTCREENVFIPCEMTEDKL